MQLYKNLILIGTSHISMQSVKEVEHNILAHKPQIIALELDSERFYALTHKRKKLNMKDIFKLGFQGFLINMFGSYIEKKLGEIVNTEPGAEMKTAIKLAKQTRIKIALIDQDIRITLAKLSKRITLREKFRFIRDIISSLIKRKKIKIDLTKVPKHSFIKKIINKLKKRYPSVYLTLIEERNEIMANNLFNLMKSEDKILAVVGAGHEEDIIKIIKTLNR